jgi:hypothetical protein
MAPMTKDEFISTTILPVLIDMAVIKSYSKKQMNVDNEYSKKMDTWFEISFFLALSSLTCAVVFTSSFWTVFCLFISLICMRLSHDGRPILENELPSSFSIQMNAIEDFLRAIVSEPFDFANVNHVKRFDLAMKDMDDYRLPYDISLFDDIPESALCDDFFYEHYLRLQVNEYPKSIGVIDSRFCVLRVGKKI